MRSSPHTPLACLLAALSSFACAAVSQAQSASKHAAPIQTPRPVSATITDAGMVAPASTPVGDSKTNAAPTLASAPSPAAVVRAPVPVAVPAPASVPVAKTAPGPRNVPTAVAAPPPQKRTTTAKNTHADEDEAIVKQLEFLMLLEMMKDYELFDEDPKNPHAP